MSLLRTLSLAVFIFSLVFVVVQIWVASQLNSVRNEASLSSAARLSTSPPIAATSSDAAHAAAEPTATTTTTTAAALATTIVVASATAQPLSRRVTHLDGVDVRLDSVVSLERLGSARLFVVDLCFSCNLLIRSNNTCYCVVVYVCASLIAGYLLGRNESDDFVMPIVSGCVWSPLGDDAVNNSDARALPRPWLLMPNPQLSPSSIFTTSTTMPSETITTIDGTTTTSTATTNANQQDQDQDQEELAMQLRGPVPNSIAAMSGARNRLVFCIHGGRVGAGYLAALLATASERVKAWHMPNAMSMGGTYMLEGLWLLKRRCIDF